VLARLLIGSNFSGEVTRLSRFQVEGRLKSQSGEVWALEPWREPLRKVSPPFCHPAKTFILVPRRSNSR